MIKNVLFGPNPSISRWIYTDVIEDKDSEYCDFDHKADGRLNKLFFTRTVQEHLPHWLLRHLYRHFLGYEFLKYPRNAELRFVFTCQYTMFFMTCFWPFVDFLKKEFPKAKFLFYYYDIIYTCCPELVERVKSTFPRVLTFDPGDAAKYGLEYYGELCSAPQPDGDCSIEAFDVFYAGGERGRFDTIVPAFFRMADLGCKNIFYVIGINPEYEPRLNELFPDQDVDLKNGCSLRYKDSVLNCNIYCPYPKALNHIEKSRCLFEVVFPGQTSGSLRLPQACIYGKKLITNCEWVKNRPFYNEENIFVFDSVDSIDVSIIKTPFKKVEAAFSPLLLFENM